MSLRFRIVFSGACAVLVALLCAAYARHVRGEAERVRQESIERYGGEVVRLVVAPAGLSAGDVIGRADVVERDWLVDLTPEGAIASIDDVLGMRVSSPVAAGAPVTELNLRDESSMPVVPEGMVAVSLPLTDKLGLARGVVAGSRLVAYRVEGGGATLISDEVQVVSAPSESSALGSASVVTVAVRANQASDLLSASATGDLRLAVPADDVRIDAENVPEAPTEVLPDGALDAPQEVLPEDGAEAAVEEVPAEDATKKEADGQ